MTIELITIKVKDRKTGLCCQYTQEYCPHSDKGEWRCAILNHKGDILQVLYSIAAMPGRISVSQCQWRLFEALRFNRERWETAGWIRGAA